MIRKHKWRFAIILAAVTVALSACASDKESAPADLPPAATEGETPSDSVGSSEPAKERVQAPTAEEPEATDQKVVKAEDLPETAELQFTVEGSVEKSPATLAVSELGYAFYLMEGFEFTPEEPGKDIVFHQKFPEFFMRIEPLPSDSNIEELRASAEEALKAVGSEVVDMKERFFDEAIRSQAEFILHASNAEGSVNMIAMPVGNQMFRITLHFPLAEAALGVTPRFYPMIQSIVSVK
jgi:hypothetical protein